jgi:hypothetical protein
MTNLDTSPFTPAERDFIRREFCKHFSSYPALADGIFLRTWRAAAQGAAKDSEGNGRPRRAESGLASL